MIVPEASHVALHRKMTSIRVSPLVCWAMMHQQQCPDWEKIVRDTLAEHGIDLPLLEAISQSFSIEKLSWFVNLLDEPATKSNALRAASIIARAYKGDHGYFRVFDESVQQIFESLNALPYNQNHDDELYRLLLLWAKSTDNRSVEFEGVLAWWVKNEGTLTFAADWTWEKVVRQYLRLASWQTPTHIPAEINGVTIRSLATGGELIEHSLHMGRDIEAAHISYEIGDALSGRKLFFHLYKTSNPSICATLSFSIMHAQYMCGEKNWQIDDFHTVGGGTPPTILAEAAEKLTQILQQKEMFWSSEYDFKEVIAA